MPQSTILNDLPFLCVAFLFITHNHTTHLPLIKPFCHNWNCWRLCDNVAFHFSFEIEQELTAKVCQRVGDEEETAVAYHVQSPGQIIIDPWPFAIPAFSGMIIGYQAEGYPDLLEPVVVPFEVNGRF